MKSDAFATESWKNASSVYFKSLTTQKCVAAAREDALF